MTTNADWTRPRYWYRPACDLVQLSQRKVCFSVELYPCSTELLAHPSLVGSKVYFFWSPTEDYCVTVWWIWFVFVDYQVSVWRVGAWSNEAKMSDDGTKCRSDTDLIVDKHKSDSSDCDTIVFRRWPEEINLASDEWRMSQKLCGTGVLHIQIHKDSDPDSSRFINSHANNLTKLANS